MPQQLAALVDAGLAAAKNKKTSRHHDGGTGLNEIRPLTAETIPICGGAYSDNCRYPRRSTISFLISAMALAGFRLLGQVLVQFMMV